jgi:hypothetical protein
MKKNLGLFCPDNYLYLNKTKVIEYNGLNLKTDYLISLMHEIILRFQLDDNDIELKEFTINLYSKILRDKYGMNYKYYVEYLIQIGFMKMKSNYFVGKKSKTYLLNWFDLDKIKRVIITDNILIKNTQKDYLKRLNVKSPINITLRKRLIENLNYINVNYDKSFEFINNLKNNKDISNDKFFKNYQSILNIKEGNIYFIFDEFGRFHTNYTVLKKEIRKNYLTINNDLIEEIDIKNSQPFFLSKILKKEIGDNNGINLFVDLVDKGLIYEYIIDKFPVYFNTEKSHDNKRSKSKKLVYKVLFGFNGIHSEQNKIFEKLFPVVYDFIIENKKSKGDYKYFSYKLMRMESDFIFGCVVPNLYSQIKDIKLFTVHDSISYPAKYKEKVERIFNYYLNNYDELFNK